MHSIHCLFEIGCSGQHSKFGGPFPGQPVQNFEGGESEHGQGECLNVLCEGFTCI